MNPESNAFSPQSAHLHVLNAARCDKAKKTGRRTRHSRHELIRTTPPGVPSKSSYQEILFGLSCRCNTEPRPVAKICRWRHSGPVGNGRILQQYLTYIRSPERPEPRRSGELIKKTWSTTSMPFGSGSSTWPIRCEFGLDLYLCRLAVTSCRHPSLAALYLC